MTVPNSLIRAADMAISSGVALKDPTEIKTARPTRATLRRYEVTALTPTGEVVNKRHLAPALPLFENAFCAFARGTMIETAMGPMAIEDLLPGDDIVTQDGSTQPLMWKGSTTLVPGHASSQERNLNLTRIMADTFGMQRPLSYVLTGPSARILHTPHHLRALAGGNPILTPVTEFVDGNNVISTAPPTPVELFHICLPRHALIRVGGLEFETYHPGVNATRMISQKMRDLFVGLFDHIQHLTDFGLPAIPRAGDGQIAAMSA